MPFSIPFQSLSHISIFALYFAVFIGLFYFSGFQTILFGSMTNACPFSNGKVTKNNIDILSNTSHCINAISSFRRKHHNLFTDKTNILIKHAMGKFGIFFGKSSLPYHFHYFYTFYHHAFLIKLLRLDGDHIVGILVTKILGI